MGPDGRGGLSGHSGGDEVPACLPGEVSVTVRWEHDGSRLRGHVIAENTGSRACRLPGKPQVRSLGLDGMPLPVENAITMEWREAKCHLTPEHIPNSGASISTTKLT
jgi:hypothetical protein